MNSNHNFRLMFFNQDFIQQVKELQAKQYNAKGIKFSNIIDDEDMQKLYIIDQQIIEMSRNVFNKIHRFCTPEQIQDGSAVILASPSAFVKNIKNRSEFIRKNRSQIDEIQYNQEALTVLRALNDNQTTIAENCLYSQLNYYIRKYEANKQ